MKNRTFMSFDLDADIQQMHRRHPGRLQMSASVRQCMDRLHVHGIILDDYIGQAEDVACDLLTAEACISGIANAILNQQPLTEDLRDVASRHLLTDDNLWYLPDGTSFDLSSIPLLRDYARQIERLRVACMEAI